MLQTQIGSQQVYHPVGVTGNSNKMPFCRRPRPHLSSIQITQMEVEGTTMLCFPSDHSWFQGNIATDDDSSYALIGERLQPKGQPSESEDQTGNDNNNNKGEGSEGKSQDEEGPVYRVTLTDHFTGLSYHLPDLKVHLDPKSPSLLTCSQDAQVRFKVDQVYRGQKADMMIHTRYGGSSALVGQNCMVYSGPISLLFNDTVSNGKEWCL